MAPWMLADLWPLIPASQGTCCLMVSTAASMPVIKNQYSYMAASTVLCRRKRACESLFIPISPAHASCMETGSSVRQRCAARAPVCLQNLKSRRQACLLELRCTLRCVAALCACGFPHVLCPSPYAILLRLRAGVPCHPCMRCLARVVMDLDLPVVRQMLHLEVETRADPAAAAAHLLVSMKAL